MTLFFTIFGFEKFSLIEFFYIHSSNGTIMRHPPTSYSTMVVLVCGALQCWGQPSSSDDDADDDESGLSVMVVVG